LHHVLGLVGGRAELVSPADCIGHGACKTACPTEAISLVFGTERRGVEIPVLNASFETNVRGVFVAGELGGMGLIRNALEQGRQAVEAIHATRKASAQQLDLVIVGAGPAGSPRRSRRFPNACASSRWSRNRPAAACSSIRAAKW
jgi:ferredoxin